MKQRMKASELTKSKCAEIAKQFNIKNEFQKKAWTAYDVARLNGWLDSICKHMKTNNCGRPNKLTLKVAAKRK
jgi:hypothetical protein